MSTLETRTKRAIAGASLLIILTFAAIMADRQLRRTSFLTAGCTTDTECAELCRALGEDCDGGPKPK